MINCNQGCSKIDCNNEKSISSNQSIKLILQKKTKLLVSGRSPEFSDCLLRFYGAVITFKN